ncbi:PulJ/GspJ family protein [Inhella gelatinilytica]|uniref:Prepilin-type N-terminal cleavage/methylation domain-containing protein n=1 Tax=Inhella gelatinilytica TaxID=2795030 RepID=A0A931NED8_9BURK|nr:prepilin-type N-terminal cleavage/methylation domain-containing protein [Inhella gelatinilytica]MBH9552411.1 prepilin-type N-terminal cleavage/methylation domain-containing protein [Inhella gelatinilytica]
MTRSGLRGFTLVEVLVALLIMALMSALGWRALDAMLRTRDITQARLEAQARLQTVMAQWQLDLENIQEIPALLPALRFDGAALRLFRRTPEGIQIVVWWHGDGKLHRWASAPQTQMKALREVLEDSQQLLTLAPRSLVALEGVAGWQMAFFFNNAWTNAQSTGGGGGAQNPNDLPTGVRMQLDFLPGPNQPGGPVLRQVLVGAG